LNPNISPPQTLRATVSKFFFFLNFFYNEKKRGEHTEIESRNPPHLDLSTLYNPKHAKSHFPASSHREYNQEWSKAGEGMGMDEEVTFREDGSRSWYLELSSQKIKLNK
jgi:hypothetical protein